jgi:hypothetical protein
MYISSRLLQASWGLKALLNKHPPMGKYGVLWHESQTKKNRLKFDKWRIEI